MSSNSNSDETTLRDLYDEFGIDRRYDHPSNISEENSHYERGNYPPDWPDRRKAVLEHQNGRCARCRTALKREDYYHTHHYRPVSEDGQHSLSNLVNLCTDCHKLIHPDVENIDGDWRQAAMFPHPDADPRMATVRQPVTDEEKQKYQPELSLIAEKSPIGENEFPDSDVTIPVSPADALRMRNDFEGLLEDMGLAEKTELTVRAVNSEHSPLRNASVGIRFPASGTILSGRTDKHGEASFNIPIGTKIQGKIRKEDFEEASFTLEVSGGEEYQEVTLETSSQVAAAGAASGPSNPANEDGSDESRRPILKTLGLLGVGGVAGYFLSGDGEGGSNTNSAPSGGSSGGSGPTSAQEDTATATEVPIRGFSQVWSNTTDTFEAVTHVEEFNGALYTATASGLLRQFDAEGGVTWSDNTDAPVVEISPFEDGVAVLTENNLTLREHDSGEPVWSIEVPTSRTSINTSGEAILLSQHSGDEGYPEGFLAGIDTQSGEELWRLAEMESGPVIEGVHQSEAYFHDRELRYVEDITEGPGEQADPVANSSDSWESDVGMAFASESSLAYFTNYADGGFQRASETKLIAVDTDRYTQVWNKVILSGDEASEPQSIKVNKKVVFTTYSSVALTEPSGDLVWRQSDVGGSDLVAHWGDDQLFSRTDEGEVAGIRTSDGEKTHSQTLDAEIETMTKFQDGFVVTTGEGETRMLSPE